MNGSIIDQLGDKTLIGPHPRRIVRLERMQRTVLEGFLLVLAILLFDGELVQPDHTFVVAGELQGVVDGVVTAVEHLVA